MALYKYVSSSTCLDILESLQLRFTQPAEFNDPFEMRPHLAAAAPSDEMERRATEWYEIDRIRRYNSLPLSSRRRIPLKDFEPNPELTREQSIQLFRQRGEQQVLADMRRRMPEMINKGLGLLCLTHTRENLLMWAHYADKHAGAVLEFDETSPFFRQEYPPEWVAVSDKEIEDFRSEYGYLHDVKYSTDRPAVTVTTMNGFKSLLVKSKEWDYENEVRMLMPLEYAKKTIRPEGARYPIHLFPFPPDALTGVTFGTNSSEQFREKATELLRGRKETRHVQTEVAALDIEHFRLVFEIQ